MESFSAFDMIGFTSLGRRGSGSLETGDRFIPRRRSSESYITGFLQRASPENSDDETSKLAGAHNYYGLGRNYTSNTSTPSPVVTNLIQASSESAEFGGPRASGRRNSDSRILSFFSPHQPRGRSNSVVSPDGGVFGSSPVLEQVRHGSGQKQSRRPLPKVPDSVLDLPGIRTDYPSNMLSWRLSGELTVPIGQEIHMWHPLTDEVSVIRPRHQGSSSPTEPVNVSVAWDPTGAKVAYGCENGTFSVVDDSGRATCTYQSGEEAIRCFAWTPNDVNVSCLFTGDDYGSIRRYDTRDPNNNERAILIGQHAGPVLALAVSPDGRYLASSGTDSILRVWNISTGKALHSIKGHLGPINALAWCPWQMSLVATGDGSEEDATIRLWNINKGSKVAEVNTGAPINALLWSSRCRELVSAHGGSGKAVCLWRWPSFDQVGRLARHDASVLGLALSPDGATLAAVNIIECLELWKCFEGSERSSHRGSHPSSLLLKTIR